MTVPPTRYTVDAFGLHSIGTSSLLSCTYQDEKVVHMSCGWDHSAIVTESGRVFTFGANDFGKLGHGNTRKSMSAPTLVKALTSYHIVQSACGNECTLFLTDKGELFGCGNNGDGQFGLGLKTHSWLPLKVAGIPPFRKVVSGWGHTAALTEHGELWVSGWNSQGQLGLNHRETQTSFVQVTGLPSPITDVSCGERHTTILSESEDILVTGRNKEGQLGFGTDEDAYSFKHLVLPSKVFAMACGSSHTIALTTDGCVWSWGYNVCGQLGMGDKTNRTEPSMLIGQNDHCIVKVFAGNHHSAFLTERGEVLMCGRGASGELGQGVDDQVVAAPITISPNLEFVHLEFAWGYTLMLVAEKPDRKSEPKILE